MNPTPLLQNIVRGVLRQLVDGSGIGGDYEGKCGLQQGEDGSSEVWKGEKGWGQKVSAIWSWKNRLPAEFPDEIFYGKIKGGVAVLMTMEYLRDCHFASSYRCIDELNPLSAHIFEKIRNEPWETTSLRKEVIEEFGCSKSQFNTALKNLQISLNIVRSNDPEIERDTWLAFQELYPDIWDMHVSED